MHGVPKYENFRPNTRLRLFPKIFHSLLKYHLHPIQFPPKKIKLKGRAHELRRYSPAAKKKGEEDRQRQPL